MAGFPRIFIDHFFTRYAILAAVLMATNAFALKNRPLWEYDLERAESRAAQFPMVQQEIRQAIWDFYRVADDMLATQSFHFEEPYLEKFIRFFISEYVKNISRHRAYDILRNTKDYVDRVRQLPLPESSFLPRNSRDPLAPEVRFRFASKFFGPSFHKLFQLMGRDHAMPRDLSGIFSSFEEGLPFHDDRKVYVVHVRLPSGQKIVLRRGKDIKSGSMAQVSSFNWIMAYDPAHRVQVADLQFAYREIKDGIEVRVREDNEIFDKMIQKLEDPNFSPFYADPSERKFIPVLVEYLKGTKQMTEEELDISRTVARQQMAKKEYEGKYSLRTQQGKSFVVNLVVPQVYEHANFLDGERLVDQGAFVQEKVSGVTFDAVLAINPQLASRAAEVALQVWLKTAVLGSGYYHGDPQLGNLKFEIVSANEITVHFLDYGLTSTLSKIGQDAFLLLGLGSQMGDVDIIEKALDMVAIRPSNIRREIQERQKVAKKPLSAYEWGIFASKQGVTFHRDFFQFTRGVKAMDNLLFLAGSSLSPEALLYNSVSKLALASRLGVYVSQTELRRLLPLLPKLFGVVRQLQSQKIADEVRSLAPLPRPEAHESVDIYHTYLAAVLERERDILTGNLGNPTPRSVEKGTSYYRENRLRIFFESLAGDESLDLSQRIALVSNLVSVLLKKGDAELFYVPIKFVIDNNILLHEVTEFCLRNIRSHIPRVFIEQLIQNVLTNPGKARIDVDMVAHRLLQPGDSNPFYARAPWTDVHQSDKLDKLLVLFKFWAYGTYEKYESFSEYILKNYQFRESASNPNSCLLVVGANRS